MPRESNSITLNENYNKIVVECFDLELNTFEIRNRKEWNRVYQTVYTKKIFPKANFFHDIKSLQLKSKNCATIEQQSHGNQPDQTRLIVPIRLKKRS